MSWQLGDVLLVLVLVAVLVIWGMAKTGHARIRAHGIHVLAWRWFSGQAWHGHPITDAGWRRDGVRALTPTGHATRWWHLRQWKRAAWRTGGTAAALITAWEFLLYPQVTAIAIVCICFVCIALAGWLLVRRAIASRHRRSWLHPLHLAAHQVAGIPRAKAAASWISIDRDRTKVVLALPPGWPADDKDKQRLVAIASAKTGLEAPDASWRLAGPDPQLTLTASMPPPARVTLSDIRDAIERARSDELIAGLGKRGKIIGVSLAEDSPHIAVSCGTGAGKSVLARSLGAQALYKGALLLVLDFKLISHQWARGLPNVAYAGRIAEIHRALLWLGDEIQRRSEVALAAADIEGRVHANVGPRLIVIAEEQNAMMRRLRDYWTERRGTGDPAKSPAITCFEESLFLGRQILINDICIGQMMSANASGSGEARENMGIRCLGRYSQNNWKMMVPEHPMPAKSMTPGRIQIVTSAVAETQVAFMTGAQAREMALAGTVAAPLATRPGGPPSPFISRVPAAPQIENGGAEQPVSQGHGPRVLAPAGMVTLSEAVFEGIVSCKLPALRKASQRDPEFPERAGLRGLAHEYDAEKLALWDAGRS